MSNGMLTESAPLEGRNKKLWESPCKKLAGNQLGPVVTVIESAASRVVNTVPGIFDYGDFPDLIPATTTMLQAAQNIWTRFTSRSEHWTSGGGHSYTGQLAIVGAGQALTKSGWPTLIFVDGSPADLVPYQIGQGGPSLAQQLICGATYYNLEAQGLGSTGNPTPPNFYYAGPGGGGCHNFGYTLTESVDVVCSGDPNAAGYFGGTMGAFTNYNWPLDYNQPPFGLTWNDAPPNQYSNPATYDGSMSVTGPNFPFGSILAPQPIQLGSDPTQPFVYAGSGWDIGYAQINLFRGRALVLGNQIMYYWIGRWQHYYAAFPDIGAPAHHWAARLSYISDGWAVPVAGKIVIEAPFPNSSPFPLNGIQNVGVASDIYFVVVGQDPIAWFNQWYPGLGSGLTFGGPPPRSNPRIGFGDYYL